MSANTGIQWTTHTFNPWWGCVKVAQGCKNCYAEGVAQRFYGRKIWGPNTERRIASEKVWNDPHRWNRAAEKAGKRERVFCLSMGDVCEDHPALIEPRKRLVGIIEETPWLDWQLLTKRPENAGMLGWGSKWPIHVWFGASASTQAECDANELHVWMNPARIRFLSLEPLIGPVVPQLTEGLHPRIQWVIVGGESGQGVRAHDIAWTREIVRRCRAKRTACFVKQLGARPLMRQDSLEGRRAGDHPEREWPEGTTFGTRPGDPQGRSVFLRDPKGGDMAEWPEDLRVREMPEGDR